MDFYCTFWALVPAVVAIVLALITKEVYSSLFIGIVVGGILYSNFSPVGTLNHVFSDGMIAQLSDSWNVGIIIFLVILGIMVALINKAGGSAAFGVWSSKHVKTRRGALLSTVALGVLVFIDDYFNCLTVGSVMRPVTDKHKISRAKLAYLIDATAAPVCIIAPISSWAAAVSGFVKGYDGISLFVKAIPYNYYALLTIFMMLFITTLNFDYGPMKKRELDAAVNESTDPDRTDLFDESTEVSTKGRVIHLVFPIVILVISCVIGMIYTGGFFEGAGFVEAFSNSDASLGLVFGSAVALIITIAFYLITRVMKFSVCMSCVPEGFKAMVPAILILTCAWTLKAMTDSLGAKEYVAGIVSGSAGSFMAFLPAIIFVIAAFLAFATGTSWGTFGILIPIVVSVFSADKGNEIMIISISACMAGAVCGDHCSPISDTTIMASAGAQCKHISHVSTQLPYAVTVAAVTFVNYIIAGFVQNPVICLVTGFALMTIVLLVIRNKTAKDDSELKTSPAK